MKTILVTFGLLLLAGVPSALGARQLSAVVGTGTLPQPPNFASLGTINTQASPVQRAAPAPAAAPAQAPVGLAAPVAAPIAAPVAAPAAAPAATPVPAVEAVVAQAPVSQPSAKASAAFGAFAPAPGLAAASRRAVPPRSVFILDADYATLTVPDPSQPEQGTLDLTGFSSHVSFFTDRGSGVRRSGRLPITNFANVSFPDASNATVNGTDNSTAQPNAALYEQAETLYGNSDRLLRVLTLRGKPSVDSTNTTLTFNITLAPSYADDDTVTVYRVSFNTTANGTDTPQVSEQQYGTTDTYDNVALYVGNWWWGVDDDAANFRRHEERREQSAADAWTSWLWP